LLSLFSQFNHFFKGTTHQQIDEYSRRRTEQIAEEVVVSINRIVADTQVQQQALSADANARSAVIEDEYKIKLQKYVEELDTVKAQNLAALEKDLRDGPREYRSTYTYIGAGKILDLEFDYLIR
jgi:phage host-nuclease inhibitor protein Gam